MTEEISIIWIAIVICSIIVCVIGINLKSSIEGEVSELTYPEYGGYRVHFIDGRNIHFWGMSAVPIVKGKYYRFMYYNTCKYVVSVDIKV